MCHYVLIKIMVSFLLFVIFIFLNYIYFILLIFLFFAWNNFIDHLCEIKSCLFIFY